MHVESFLQPAWAVALALAAGMLATAAARHLKLPSIVLLLATGVLLGPDLLGWIRPAGMEDTIQVLVGFAVAIILFEGGMNLNLSDLKQQALPIRRLVTLGALVTAVGAFLCATLLLRWDWRLSALFGSLVIVTGPTVIQPLLRRLRLRQEVATVLEAEAVFIDPIGAVLAVVTLEVVLQPSAFSLGSGLIQLLLRLGAGAVMGAVSGLLIATLLRPRWLVPEGLENGLVLALVLLCYQLSDALQPESGIMTVTVAGLVVGNIRTRALRDLKEFKEQLTVLMIGLLFVLLAADVSVSDLRSLGVAGAAVVALLMVLVRPLNVLAGTAGSNLGWRERTLLSWVAPRGVVAAAIATLFAQALGAAGIEGGRELRALVFLLIAVTVVVQGLTAGGVARLLGLRRPTDTGWVLLSAGPLARALAGVLRSHGDEVVLIDSNPHACHRAREDGFMAIRGNGLAERTLQAAQLDGRAGCIALTLNEEANLLFATRAKRDYGMKRIWVALRRGPTPPQPEQLAELGARLLFAEARPLELWQQRIESGTARLARFDRRDEERSGDAPEPEDRGGDGWPETVLPLAVVRGKELRLVDEGYSPRLHDTLLALVADDDRARARSELAAIGWQPAAEEPAEG